MRECSGSGGVACARTCVHTMPTIAAHSSHENGVNRFHMLCAVVVNTTVSTSSVYIGVLGSAVPHVRGTFSSEAT